MSIFEKEFKKKKKKNYFKRKKNVVYKPRTAIQVGKSNPLLKENPSYWKH